jgi:H+/Cl- antiporter ClcA
MSEPPEYIDEDPGPQEPEAFGPRVIVHAPDFHVFTVRDTDLEHLASLNDSLWWVSFGFFGGLAGNVAVSLLGTAQPASDVEPRLWLGLAATGALALVSVALAVNALLSRRKAVRRIYEENATARTRVVKPN